MVYFLIGLAVGIIVGGIIIGNNTALYNTIRKLFGK